MQQLPGCGLRELCGGENSVTYVVAEIPTSAVGEHDAQVHHNILSEEGCNSLIDEEVTEILQVESAHTVWLLPSNPESGGNNTDCIFDFRDENMDCCNRVVCEVSFNTTPEDGVPILVPNRRLDDSCKELAWADRVLREQTFHSELEERTTQLKLLKHVSKKFAFGVF